MMARHVSRASAAFLIAGALAMGCSHAWDVLEPLPGAGGSTSASSGMGGLGGADATSTTSSASGTTSSAQGTGGATVATSTAQGTGGVTSTTDASSSDVSSSVASSSSSTGGGGAMAYYGASFAACNSDQNLDTAACESQYGLGTMDIDFINQALVTDRAFIRFELDGTFAGKTIDAVTLRLTTLSDPATEANSNSSGQIWRVTPFDAASLLLGQPAAVGVIGMDLGQVDVGKDYYWGLPIDLVAPNSSVFLAVDTQSDDGVRYWNDHGTAPPLLIVDYH